MTNWVIIPVKRLSEAKSTLGSALTPEQRHDLVLCMLEDILNAVKRSKPVSATVVVSPDEEVLNFARLAEVFAVTDPDLELNDALGIAIDYVKESGGSSALIIPGDIPLLSPIDVTKMFGLASQKRDVVIATSKRKGTNAMLLRPPDVMGLRFGGESFPLHIEEARRAGITPHIYQSERIETDLDEVTDLTRIEALGVGTLTYDFLRSLDL